MAGANKAYPLDTPPEPKKGKPILDWAKAMTKWARKNRLGPGQGYHMTMTAAGRALVIDTHNRFSGFVWVGGSRFQESQFTGTASQYLKVFYDGSTAPEYKSQGDYDSAVTNGQPDDGEIFNLVNTYGDIHITRA